jgi:NADH:ubiquinone reductase (non-electrogenic)
MISDLINQLGSAQPIRRGLSVDEYLKVKGTSNIWALGDCSVTPQNYPATAQVASQEGRYLGRLFNDLADSFYQAKKVRSE